MSDRAKGAIFNALGDLEGVSVLDAYAGSGALAFESASRGAESVIAVDKDKKAYKVLLENTASLGLESQVKATRANISTWLKNNQQVLFDVVFADPPYYDINPDHIILLGEHVELGGLLVISHADFYRPNFSKPKWQLVSHKKYAAANISIYRKLKV